MDAKLVNIFISSTINILSTVASATADVQKPSRKKDALPTGDVSSVMALSGNTAGIITISFAEACILGIVSTMFGEEVKEMNEEITDAVGEISNMICGQATNRFAELDATLKVNFSNVIEGKDDPLPHIANVPVIAIPVTTNLGDLHIEWSIEA